MKIQYVSDLHWEFYDTKNTGEIEPSQMITPSAPYLVLAGDIGIPELKSYSRFLEWCSKRWTKIFLVAGNHEYYNTRCPVKTDIRTKRELLKKICAAFPTVVFLDCTSVVVPEENLRILGCTLWSDIPDCLREKVLTTMNDSRQIQKEKDVPFSPGAISEQHQREKQWLNEEIHKCELTNERCLVITHYLPSYSLIAEKYQGHFLNACFASECEDLMRPPVVAWICGHSHTGMNLNLHGVQCVMNPYGYPHEEVETRNKAAVLEI